VLDVSDARRSERHETAPIVQAAEKKTPLRVQLELLSSLMQRRQLKRLAGAA